MPHPGRRFRTRSWRLEILLRFDHAQPPTEGHVVVADLRAQLRAVRGVAEINAWGGAEKQWHVVVDPRRLQSFGLSIGDVYRALESSNANVGGGMIERGGSASLVLGVGVIEDGRQLAEIVVAARGGVPIRVRDVAQIEVGHEIRSSAGRCRTRGRSSDRRSPWSWGVECWPPAWAVSLSRACPMGRS